jgi:hypothetical protein
VQHFDIKNACIKKTYKPAGDGKMKSLEIVLHPKQY